jgi:transposase-like protein
MTTIHAESRPTSRSELSAWYRSALADQVGSGLSVAEYAEEIGVTPATLYSWRRRLESAPSPKPRREAPGLVRVQVRHGAELSAARAEALVVRVGRSRSIEVPAGFDADELARVIEVLETC